MTTRRQHTRNTRGYFGIGVWHPKSEVNIGGLWRHAYLYGASYIFTIGQRFKKVAADTPKTWRHIPMFTYASIVDFLANRPFDAPLVGIEMTDDAYSLPTYAHPERAIYLLGAEDHGLPEKILELTQQRLTIPCPSDFSMNVSTAGTVMMYDRYIKRQWRKR